MVPVVEVGAELVVGRRWLVGGGVEAAVGVEAV